VFVFTASLITKTETGMPMLRATRVVLSHTFLCSKFELNRTDTGLIPEGDNHRFVGYR